MFIYKFIFIFSLVFILCNTKFLSQKKNCRHILSADCYDQGIFECLKKFDKRIYKPKKRASNFFKFRQWKIFMKKMLTDYQDLQQFFFTNIVQG